ncbi:MAG: hypothetical protein M4579_006874 [Chaenotheca gracillima]|nr:MAG: hypothetical protein M4579_006874 [Chaenotheca gracillima]
MDQPTPEATGTTKRNSLEDGPIKVSLTDQVIDVQAQFAHVKSPKAGAVVVFAGTTRDTFGDKAVTSLTYSAYPPVTLKTMMGIARTIRLKHDLTAISMIHRVGNVPIGEESIIIAVSAPHRQAAWRAGEEALEECKSRVEVWKREEFEDGGVWRANRDGVAGVQDHATENSNDEATAAAASQGHDNGHVEESANRKTQKQREQHLRIHRT